jgi:hypothetical protein
MLFKNNQMLMPRMCSHKLTHRIIVKCRQNRSMDFYSPHNSHLRPLPLFTIQRTEIQKDVQAEFKNYMILLSVCRSSKRKLRQLKPPKGNLDWKKHPKSKVQKSKRLLTLETKSHVAVSGCVHSTTLLKSLILEEPLTITSNTTQ